MTILTALGLMSGTSMDGIDVALIRSDGENRVERGPSAEFPFDPATRKAIEQGLIDALKIGDDRKQRPGALEPLEHMITRLHIDAVNQFLTQNSLTSRDIDIIGFHGQTVLHRPDDGVTVQLGLGQMLADETQIDVVYDLRANDMAQGGQGAPLVPVYHRALAASLKDTPDATLPMAFVNIGGISNITYCGSKGELIAFDTGPGNALIDQWVRSGAGIPFDSGGRIASEGGAIDALVERYMAMPYFAKPMPKSLDRNDFPPLQSGEAELADGARTLARITAQSVMACIKHLPESPKLWVICGGGRKNAAIMADLEELAADMSAKVMSAEQAGFNGDAMEAEAFAYLAIRSVNNLPISFSKTTGCRSPTCGGLLTTTE